MSNLSNHFPTHEAITMCPTCPTISRIENETGASVQPVQPFWGSEAGKIVRVSNLSNHFPTSHTYTKKKYMYMYMYIVHGGSGILVGQVGQPPIAIPKRHPASPSTPHHTSPTRHLRSPLPPLQGQSRRVTHVTMGGWS